MASSSETGHAKNVANFEDLISFCTGYGLTYNPSKATIKLLALGTLRTDAKLKLVAVTTASTKFINMTNARQIIFSPIKSLATRIVNALANTDASTEMIDDAKTINRKIQGRRKGGDATPPPPAPTPGTPPPEGVTPGDDKQISVSQQSFDSLIENFKKLVALVGSEPTYTPNEIELQIVTLNTLVTNPEAGNTDVINSITALSNSRIARNKTLYQPKTGLYDVAQDVKKYVKSVFGATSPEYKQVSGIKFTDLSKK